MDLQTFENFLRHRFCDPDFIELVVQNIGSVANQFRWQWTSRDNDSQLPTLAKIRVSSEATLEKAGICSSLGKQEYEFLLIVDASSARVEPVLRNNFVGE